MADETSESYQGGGKAAKYKDVKNFWGDPAKAKAYLEKQKKWVAKSALPLVDRPCQKCGAPLHFARTHEGKTIPLDLRPHIYCIVYDRTEPRQPSQVVRTELCYVSHFFTCPFADEFSKHRKGAGGTADDGAGTVPVEDRDAP